MNRSNRRTDVAPAHEPWAAKIIADSRASLLQQMGVADVSLSEVAELKARVAELESKLARAEAKADAATYAPHLHVGRSASAPAPATTRHPMFGGQSATAPAPATTRHPMFGTRVR